MKLFRVKVDGYRYFAWATDAEAVERAVRDRFGASAPVAARPMR